MHEYHYTVEMCDEWLMKTWISWGILSGLQNFLILINKIASLTSFSVIKLKSGSLILVVCIYKRCYQYSLISQFPLSFHQRSWQTQLPDCLGQSGFQSCSFSWEISKCFYFWPIRRECLFFSISFVWR